MMENTFLEPMACWMHLKPVEQLLFRRNQNHRRIRHWQTHRFDEATGNINSYRSANVWSEIPSKSSSSPSIFRNGSLRWTIDTARAILSTEKVKKECVLINMHNLKRIEYHEWQRTKEKWLGKKSLTWQSAYICLNRTQLMLVFDHCLHSVHAALCQSFGTNSSSFWNWFFVADFGVSTGWYRETFPSFSVTKIVPFRSSLITFFPVNTNDMNFIINWNLSSSCWGQNATKKNSAYSRRR